MIENDKNLGERILSCWRQTLTRQNIDLQIPHLHQAIKNTWSINQTDYPIGYEIDSEGNEVVYLDCTSVGFGVIGIKRYPLDDTYEMFQIELETGVESSIRHTDPSERRTLAQIALTK